jgi:hypothetical protein
MEMVSKDATQMMVETVAMFSWMEWELLAWRRAEMAWFPREW